MIVLRTFDCHDLFANLFAEVHVFDEIQQIVHRVDAGMHRLKAEDLVADLLANVSLHICTC